MTKPRTTNKDLAEMWALPELDPGLKRFPEEDEVDEDRIKQADAFFESIKSFIDANKWHPSAVDQENRVLELRITLKNAWLIVRVCVDADAECVTINSILPISCEDEYRMLMRSMLSRINENLKYGLFSVDDDGEITYRFTYSISGQEFNDKMFDNYLGCCLITPDMNYKKIVKYAIGVLNDDEKTEVLADLKSLERALNW